MKQAYFSKDSGFTLIELGIVISVIAILVALAVPAYKNYTVRSKVAECIGVSAAAKLQISEYRLTMGPWPPDEASAGLVEDAGSRATKFCTELRYQTAADGSFAIDVDETRVGYPGVTIEPFMIPTASAQGVQWSCTPGNTSASAIKMLPPNCKS